MVNRVVDGGGVGVFQEPHRHLCPDACTRAGDIGNSWVVGGGLRQDQ